MSTCFVAKMPKDEFVKRAVELGWKEGVADTGAFALVSPNGHYCHDIVEEPHDESAVTFFTRYGQNFDVYELSEEIGAFSEHSDEFEAYFEEHDTEGAE